jgi:GTPase-associated system helical domain
MSEAEDRLAGWIREVDLEPGATRLEVVRGAATTLAKSTDNAEILDLVFLAHGSARGQAVSLVDEAVRQHDEASAVREGDLLAALTAAAAAAFALEGEANVAIPFGLAVRSANFLGLQPAVPELDALARAGLAHASDTERRRTKLSVVGAKIETALEGWSDVPDGQPVYGENLRTAYSAVEKAAKAAGAVAPRALPPITRRFEALEEEVDVLWWAFAEYSELADKAFNSLPEHAAACVAGIELASHTARRAPLPSARAILSRVLESRADKATDVGRALPAAVKAIGENWVDRHPDGHPLLPVLSSLEEYRSLGHRAVWKEAIAARWGVDPARTTTILELAEQVTREILLARSPTE